MILSSDSSFRGETPQQRTANNASILASTYKLTQPTAVMLAVALAVLELAYTSICHLAAYLVAKVVNRPAMCSCQKSILGKDAVLHNRLCSTPVRCQRQVDAEIHWCQPAVAALQLPPGLTCCTPFKQTKQC